MCERLFSVPAISVFFIQPIVIDTIREIIQKLMADMGFVFVCHQGNFKSLGRKTDILFIPVPITGKNFVNAYFLETVFLAPEGLEDIKVEIGSPGSMPHQGYHMVRLPDYPAIGIFLEPGIYERHLLLVQMQGRGIKRGMVNQGGRRA